MADKNDLPENLTDLPNMSTLEQYNGVNVGGTHYSPSEMNNTLRTVAQKGTSEPTIVYMSTPAGGTNANGQTVGKPEWSLNPYSMTLQNSSVTLDTDTGDIKVSAPQVVLDSLQVKSWQDSGVLKQLSSYYKRNPDSKLKNPLDSSDEGEYTPEQLVEKFDEAITKTAEEVTKQQNIKRDLYNQTYVYGDGEKWAQIASSLTPEDFVIMGASPWRESAKGTDLLAIPKSLYPIFKDVDGFNAETGTISKDDFLSNYYNLSKTSDQDISNLTDWYKEYMAHGDYLGDDGIDTDEYARWQAFNAFTSNVSPTTDPANWIRRTTSDVFASAGNAGLEVIYSIGSLVEGGLNWATGGDATGMQEAYQWRQEESEKYTEYASRLTSVGGAISGLTTLGADMVIDFIVTDVAVATGGAAIGAVGGAALKTGRTITNLVKGANKSGKVLGTTQKVTKLLEGGAVTTEAILTTEKGLAAGAKVASEDERLVALTRVLSESATKATAATTEVAEAATTVARDGLKTISTTQKISRAGASLVSGGEAIASGASTALRAQTEAGKGAEFLNAYIETARQMQNVSRTSNAILSLARLTAESVVSAAIWEPDAVRGLLEGDYSEENKEALLLNIAFDAGVFGALRLGGALAREASLTPTGQVLTAYGQKGTNWLAVHTHDLNNKVHTAIWGQDWITNIKRSSKKRARQINEILNESRRPLATEKRMKGEDVWAFVKRQNTNAVRHAAVQNAIDNLERGAKGSAMRFLQKSRNAKLNGYENNLRDISNKMYKAERKLGIGSKRRIFGQVDPQNDTVRLFSEHTANYLGARQQLAVLDAIEEKLGSLSPEQEKGRGLLQEMYDTAVERMGGAGSELVNLADQFYVENARWWREFNDARVAEGLLNADDINSLRESGLWGENGELYQRTGRVKGEPTYVVTRADGSFKRGNITELESYVWGSADSFADPTVVRYDALLEAGGELNSRELRDAVANIPGMKMEQVLSAEQTEAVKNVKQWRKDFASMMKSAERDVFKKTFSENGVMGTLVDKKLMRQEIGRAQREQDKAAAKVTRAEQKAANAVFEAETNLNEKSRVLEELLGKEAADRLDVQIGMKMNEGIDEFVRTVAEDKATQKTLKGIFDAYGISEAERGLNAQYIILRELQKDWSDFEKATYGYFARQAQTAISVEPSLAGQTDRLANEFQEMFKSRVQSRVDDLSARLADAKSPLLDYEHLYSEIGKLDNEIRGAKKSINNRENVIAYQNREGRVEYYRVDPAVADLYNFDAAREEIGSVGKLFNISAKIYRLSTTGVNIKSFVSQSFRDSINAFVGGNMAATFGRAATKLEREFGDRIVGDLRGYSPEFSRNLDALAEQSGNAVEGEAVGFLGEEANRLAPGSTETEAYKQTRDTRRQLDATAIDRVEDRIDRVANKLGGINEKRERYIRKTVYMNTVYDALKRGYSTQEAMTMAQFVMNNASTNFSRTLVHLGKLSRSVPYLGAAVNGTKSFWRLFSIDPVGMASRFVGGVAIPVMGLTALTLSDPETREKYKSLNEYEKDEFLIFGANGQLIKIPLPQEFSAITNPFRQMVETMYDADNKTFWEFCLHDAVQAVPYNLDGFFEVDANDFLGDDNIFNRMSTGTLGLLSGVTPRPIVAAITALTGRDMYTGKLLDNDYVVWDEESESWVKATNANSEFATVIAENVGGSAGVLGEVLDSLFGETGMDVANTLTTLFTKGAEAAGNKLVDVTAGRLVKPMTVEDYDRNKARWNRSLAELYNQKESIIGSDKWQKNEQAINMAESDEARKKYLSARNDMLADWYKNVENTIKNLTEADPNGFDRYRQAAVLSLLNTKHTVSGLSAATREAQQQLYYEGRNEAINQLVKWGASTSDQSILGYIDKNGEVKINTPLEILAAQNVVYSQASLAQSNLEILLEDSGTDYAEQKKAVNSQISAIYNRKGTIKDKLTDDDYDEIENLQLAWNARVMAAVAPYIQQVGPEVALNSQDTLDYLRKFFLVPSDYKLDKKGYRVSDTSLAGGDSDEAYIREYIKAAFGMNDTSWGGGKNYSTRATLGAGSE